MVTVRRSDPFGEKFPHTTTGPHYNILMKALNMLQHNGCDFQHGISSQCRRSLRAPNALAAHCDRVGRRLLA
jgi:hypothetical protein